MLKKYKKKNRVWFAAAWLCILISNLFAVTMQFFKGDVLDYAIQGEGQTTVKYAVLLFAFILGEVSFYFMYNQFSARYIVGCTRCLKHDIFERILRRSYVEFKDKQTGEYIAKYTNEADTIRSLHFSMLPVFWDILLKIVFVSIALFCLDFRIAIITLVLLTTPLYVPKLIEKQLQKTQTEYLQAVERNLAKVNDWLAGFEIIKNFSMERKIMEIFTESSNRAMEKMQKDRQLGAISQLMTTLISYLSYFIVLVCATWLVLSGVFTAGDFFVAIGMIDQLSYPLISLAGIIRQLVAIKPACESMDKFLEASQEPQPECCLRELKSEIRFWDAAFSYDGQNPVLKSFHFTLQKGKRYLLKGPSGCGKTTVVNLLLRYYDVDSGRLTVDGAPIERYESTYDCVTVVRQEAVLFHDTLRNNLTMYRDIADEKLMQLLSDLGLDKYANAKALDSIVSENGSNFSGGEKKRICLGRALLRNTDVIIFDEPLANLDEETARKIEDLLLKIEDRTVLIVSHQFTVEKLDQFSQVYDFERR